MKYTLLLLVFSGFAHASQVPAQENPPKGLAASDWSNIRAAYDAGRHSVHRQDDGSFTARNPSQQWRPDFDGKGFTVTPDHGQPTWVLELIGYNERTLPAALTHQGGKISCRLAMLVSNIVSLCGQQQWLKQPTNQDTGCDGMNAASEFNMAALGFNWQVSQPILLSKKIKLPATP